MFEPVTQEHRQAGGGGLTHRASLSPEQQLKKTVDELQAKLALAKGEYKTALRNLETISDEIHERRRSSAMGPRGCGVGAEGGSPAAEDLSGRKPEPDAVSGESGAHVQLVRPASWGLPHWWDTVFTKMLLSILRVRILWLDMFGKCYMFTPDIPSTC